MKTMMSTSPNRELRVLDDNKSEWSTADNRRWGWHNLYRIARYTASFRAIRTMNLRKRMRLEIASSPRVRELTSLPWFSAMVVIQNQDILYESYAADFGPDKPHSIQSITKTTANLIVGQLVDKGVIKLSQTVGEIVPEVADGYAAATVQEVLNMLVTNEYTEDFADPAATYYRHEVAMGWRVAENEHQLESDRTFVSGIRRGSSEPTTRSVQYKDANTTVLGWLAERAANRPLRLFLADIADAAGLEYALHITTDRDGVPGLHGGGCMTARDLARYFSLFVRSARGVNGEVVGSPELIRQSLTSGVAMPAPYGSVRYCNHLMVRNGCIGHGGWGGQYVMANLDTGVIGVFLSVIENEHADNREYLNPVIDMLESVTSG